MITFDIPFEVSGVQHRLIVSQPLGTPGDSWAIALDGHRIGDVVKYITGLALFIQFPQYPQGLYTRHLLYSDDFVVIRDMIEASLHHD